VIHWWSAAPPAFSPSPESLGPVFWLPFSNNWEQKEKRLALCTHNFFFLFLSSFLIFGLLEIMGFLSPVHFTLLVDRKAPYHKGTALKDQSQAD